MPKRRLVTELVRRTPRSGHLAVDPSHMCRYPAAPRRMGIQTWDIQHIAEILNLQDFSIVVYTDGSWLMACSPMICATYRKIA
jgi:hypothetical protein